MLKVWCDGCKEFHPTDSVVVENVESDHMERDLVTFECMVDGNIHKGICVS